MRINKYICKMRNKKSIISFSRELRKNLTNAESILWEEIRNRNINGFKFRRQHPIGISYIADFYCAEKKLVIEIDGGIHNDEEVMQNDKIREDFLLEWGYKIIRFNNDDVVNNTEMVIESIKKALI